MKPRSIIHSWLPALSISILASLGSLAVADQLVVEVELQNFLSGTRTRDVTFIATGSNQQPWIKTETVTFVNGKGTITLVDPPAGMTSLSAKTAWNLRRKLNNIAVSNGSGTASFTDGNKLLGGDITGDNAVNMLDHSKLRHFWMQSNTEADIDGSSGVDSPDYAILRANFYTVGDAE